MMMQLQISPSMRSITISSSNGFLDSMKVRVSVHHIPYRMLFHTILALAFLLPFIFILTTMASDPKPRSSSRSSSFPVTNSGSYHRTTASSASYSSWAISTNSKASSTTSPPAFPPLARCPSPEQTLLGQHKEEAEKREK